eukprot:5898866-Pleurochrysis_carterae.AAC.4
MSRQLKYRLLGWTLGRKPAAANEGTEVVGQPNLQAGASAAPTSTDQPMAGEAVAATAGDAALNDEGASAAAENEELRGNEVDEGNGEGTAVGAD